MSKELSGTTPGGKREQLGKVLPLDAPFLVQIFPVYACNFKCKYCLLSLPKSEHGYISTINYMPLDEYKKTIDDMKLFDKKVKMIRFAGIGEPLLHPNIAEMVSYAKESGVAESIDIVTNGAMLTKELSEKLIESGLDRLRISIQGINNKKYFDLCNVKISFDSIIENIAFFYNMKKDTEVYIKIIDSGLETELEKNRFFEIFSPIADFVNVECMTPTVSKIDYSKFSSEDSFEKTQSGSQLIESNICPQPFYMMQINPDGNIIPCCSMTYPIAIGNAYETSVVELWKSIEFNNFRFNMLDGVSESAFYCSSCNLYKYGLLKEDVLDVYYKRLKEVYKNG